MSDKSSDIYLVNYESLLSALQTIHMKLTLKNYYLQHCNLTGFFCSSVSWSMGSGHQKPYCSSVSVQLIKITRFSIHW